MPAPLFRVSFTLMGLPKRSFKRFNEVFRIFKRKSHFLQIQVVYHRVQHQASPACQDYV